LDEGTKTNESKKKERKESQKERFKYTNLPKASKQTPEPDNP
jgi:hypothetical protein